MHNEVRQIDACGRESDHKDVGTITMAMDSNAYSATERRGVMAIFSHIELRAIIHPEKWPAGGSPREETPLRPILV